jgi:uncharacterized protein YggE
METSKKWFWVLFDILVAAGVLVLLFGLWPAIGRWGAAMPPARTVSVSAQGQTTATPDLAVVSFSVVTQGKTPADLSDTNNTKMAAVISFVASQGIASSDIKTTSYDLEPNYGYVVPVNSPNMPIPSYPQTIIGYTLTQTVEVKVHDLTKVADILGGLAPLGVNQIGGVSFTFNDPDGVVAIARADALEKARAKAAEMASEAGASLGVVVNLNESSYLPMYEKSVYGAGSSGMAAVPAAIAPPVSPGTQDITDTVTVTYELK